MLLNFKSMIDKNFAQNFLSFDGVAARRRRSVGDISIQFFAFGELFLIKLGPAPTVLHPNAQVIFANGDKKSVRNKNIPDCFYTGDVTSHNGTVSVSYCNRLVSDLHIL